MTQEYTPTDEEVRHDYWSLDYPEGGYDFDVDAEEKERAEDFDRWIAAHDARVAADALRLTDGELRAVAAEMLGVRNPRVFHVVGLRTALGRLADNREGVSR